MTFVPGQQQQFPAQVYMAEITPISVNPNAPEYTQNGKPFYGVATAEGYNLKTWDPNVARQLFGVLNSKVKVTLRAKGKFIDILGLGEVQPKPQAPVPTPLGPPVQVGAPAPLPMTHPFPAAPGTFVHAPAPQTQPVVKPPDTTPHTRIYKVAHEYVLKQADIETATRQGILDGINAIAKELDKFVMTADSPATAKIRLEALDMAVKTEAFVGGGQTAITDLIATATQYENNIKALRDGA